jgi:hypothetical protein
MPRREIFHWQDASHRGFGPTLGSSCLCRATISAMLITVAPIDKWICAAENNTNTNKQNIKQLGFRRKHRVEISSPAHVDQQNRANPKRDTEQWK